MRNTFAAVTTSLLLAGTMTLAGSASADGHETVESLKAELAGLQSQLDQITAGRDYLSERLLEQAAGSNDTQEKLQAEIDSANQGRNYMAQRLETMHAQKYTTSVAHTAEIAKTQADGDSMADVAFVQIKSALEERDAAKAEIVAEQNKNSFAAILLKKAQGEAAANSALASSLQQQLDAEKAANAKLASDMESVINGRTYIENLAANAKTAAAADMTAAAADKAKLELQLATAVEGRAHIMARWDSLHAELTDIKDKAAMAEQAANWSENVSASLASQLDHLSDVEVAPTSDNKVNLRIGSAGMFKSGSKNLSDEGRYLLQQVGQTLLGQSDARILITGHTDNIPTGKGSRYKDNVDLSNRRAAEAMDHLGGVVGIELDRMSSFGVGDAQPLTSNTTAYGRELNRRVEIILSPK